MPPVSFAHRALGFAAGVLTALLEAGYFLAGGVVLGPALLWPCTRPVAIRRFLVGVRSLTGLELRRRSRFFGDTFPAGPPSVPYLAARMAAGLLSGVVLGLLGVGLLLAVLDARGLIRGSLGAWDLAGQVMLGGVLLFLALQGIAALAGLDGSLARRHFGPSEQETLKRRIAELSASRAGIVREVEKNYAVQLLASDTGGVGYLLKDRVSRVEEFLDSLNRVRDGGAAIDPEVLRYLGS